MTGNRQAPTGTNRHQQVSTGIDRHQQKQDETTVGRFFAKEVQNGL